MAWTETRGKRHRGCYRDATGKKHYTPWTNLKREAKQAAQEEEAKIRAGTWVDPTAGKLTYSEYFEKHWLPNRVVEDNTRANYLSHYNAEIKAAFGEMELRKITEGGVQRWVADMEKRGTTARTISDRFMALQVVLAGRKGVSAKRDKLIAINPCEGVTLPAVDKRPVEVYSVQECDALIEALDAWWRPLPMLASATGMRWGELMGLKVGDFSKDFAEVTVSRTVIELTKAATGTGSRFKYKGRPKGKKPRRFAIDPDASQMIRTLVRERRLFPEDRVFSMPGEGELPLRTAAWPEGEPISRHYFRQSIWARAHKATGIKQHRPHDLRGSHISWLLAGGADVTSVMHRVGHAQLSTTQAYVDALKDADERALEALQRVRARARSATPLHKTAP